VPLAAPLLAPRVEVWGGVKFGPWSLGAPARPRASPFCRYLTS